MHSQIFDKFQAFPFLQMPVFRFDRQRDKAKERPLRRQEYVANIQQHRLDTIGFQQLLKQLDDEAVCLFTRKAIVLQKIRQ